MKTWKLILAALVLFAAGAVAGGAAMRLQAKAARQAAESRRGPLPPQVWQRLEFVRRAQRDLGLSAEQRERIEGYVRESQERFRALWEPVAPAAKLEFDTLRNRINAELTPEQRQRFDKLQSERSERMRKGEGRPPEGAERPKRPASGPQPRP